ncbi:MAG: helix-turn-helix domain-containing protein [Acidimicrobiia bacterium]
MGSVERAGQTCVSLFDVPSEGPFEIRGLPSSTLTLIVLADGPVDVALGGTQIRARSFLAGLHMASAVVAGAGSLRGVQVDLCPVRVAELIGIRPGDIGAQAVPLEDLAPGLCGRIDELLVREPLRALQHDVVTATLCDWSLDVRTGSSRPPVEPVMNAAWRLLLARRGHVGVAEAAAAAGLGQRHFRTKFRAAFGLGPKQAARLMRHEAARRAIEAEPTKPLSALAADLGYADQAHLAREFRGLSGLTPTEWMTQELRILQDTT